MCSSGIRLGAVHSHIYDMFTFGNIHYAKDSTELRYGQFFKPRLRKENGKLHVSKNRVQLKAKATKVSAISA